MSQLNTALRNNCARGFFAFPCLCQPLSTAVAFTHEIMHEAGLKTLPPHKNGSNEAL
jgi:hypothetical protein